MIRVGIEALAIAVPRRFLEIGDLATARGVDPAKFITGLGAHQMAVADPGEDAVALAATAARRLIDANDVSPARIGMLVVGTETGVDHSKPVASFVQGLIGLPGAVRTFDCQHACFGGTAGLMAAAEWIASGVGAGRAALVIASDVARYEVGSPGEPTQGGGAVAMLVSATPDLLALDLGISGSFSTDVHDFWRPFGRREAVVDGHYSIQCYLDAVSGAYGAYRARATERELLRGDGLPSERLARILYHVPFCKMAKKAHGQVRKCDLEDRLGKPLSDEEVLAAAPATAESFERQVAPSLTLCSKVGNAYTASLYLGLAGLLHEQARALERARIGLFSYGSGCCSEFFSGTVGDRAAQRILAADIDGVLARRERIGIDEYERVLRLTADQPVNERPSCGAFRFAGVRDHKRSYISG